MARGKKITKPDRDAPPSASLEARENELILLATNLAEKQLRDGSASSQIIAHYLRLGTTRERLEQERLRSENELARAKRDKIQSDQRSEELFQDAINAFKTYAGHGDEEDYDEYDS